MINVLFVDDEPNILNGLQRMLRSVRDDWQVHFAASGTEALSLIKTQPIDVVVSDMKMPGMDGAQLFWALSESYPHIARVILSGSTDLEVNMRSVGLAHQYISKPCDPELLQATIARVCSLTTLLTDQTLRRLISQLPNIPSLPSLYSELVDELSADAASTRKVADIIRKDLGMTAKILQIVNSAFFGRRRHISDAAAAVEFLGLDTISSLTLGLGLISQFEFFGSSAFFANLWSHSMAVGVGASKIAHMEDPELSNHAFTAGLLHDIGKVVLAVNLPSKFSESRRLIADEQMSGMDAEKEVFGATHADVGAYLLGLWGLPGQVVEAVAFHHDPQIPGSSAFSALTAVYVANSVHPFIAAHDPSETETLLDGEYLSELALSDRVPIWIGECSSLEVETAKIQQ